MAKRTRSGNQEPRRWTLVVAAFVLGLVVVGALFVVLASPVDDSGHTSAQSSATPAPSTSPSMTPTVTQTGGNLGCGVTDTSQKLPTSTPKGITWSIWKRGALPKSKTAGPLESDDTTGVTGCYARTPVGAVMAAINISFRMSLAAPHTDIVDRQVVDGPYKAKLRDAVSSYSAPGDLPQIAGFSIVSYSKKYATIGIAIGNTSGYATNREQVAWQNGTWMLVPTADDLSSDSWQNVDNIDGYITLRGVG